MQTCEQYQEQISRMLDGDLPEAETAALRMHLEQCDACRSLYTAFSAVSAHLSDPALPPVDLSASIMAQIRQEAAAPPPVSRPKRRPALLRMTAMAAGFALILLAASRLPVWNNGNDTAESLLADTNDTFPGYSDAASDAGDGSDDRYYAANGTNHADADSLPTVEEDMEEQRTEGASKEESPAPSAAAAALQKQLSRLTLQQSNGWIDAVLTLCPLCDVTEGNHAPQRKPDAFYSLDEADETQQCEISVWQTKTEWILLVDLDAGIFTLTGERAHLQREAPDTFAWIAEAIL